MTEKTIKTEAVKQKAVELAISAIAAYKQSAIAPGYDVRLVKAADVIADYIVNGKIPSQES
ncbi:MAG: hypothetical protein LBK08_01645 [Treponema sp.]|jgi:hypothetical protein|nr:hypothetical protein [Treponema sp.]